MNKKMIDDIVWYIPFKKLRNAVREYLNYKLQIEIDKLSVLNKIDNYMNRHKGYYEKLINKSAEETYEYVSNVLSKYDVPFMPHCYYELEYILKNKPLIDGLFLEFGVYTGSTINLMSNILKDKMFYGFDSFEGLPEDWIGSNCTKGSFSLNGNLPIVNDNVKLIKGWFNESLPVFLNEHKGNIAFMHIDSDLYSSAKTIFDNVKDRVVSGTIIVFNEYYNYNNWKNHEYKAFQEFVLENKIKYKYLTFGLDTTCSVIITDI
ncbi:TylF/MycF/NovP-related O-methyltransferase [Brachyspira intermedia]|uniref:TylF/MycF/NovP-related O-methyltransferase n=3 Tax=Brachyspira intermedia TaxID=84377 RepID=UPI003007C1B6